MADPTTPPVNSTPMTRRKALKMKDLQSLAQLRDELGDYLATLERNTDSVNNWLIANKNNIILFHQRLDRALINKDEATALSLITEMGDAAGFVLSLQDFRTKSEEAFGKDNAFLKAVAGISDSLPAKLQEPLPTLTIPVEEAEEEAPPLPVVVEPKKEEKKWWSSASSWFKKDTKELAAAEEEKAKKEEAADIYRKWRLVQTEILGLQSDRHYYIDSFMDWVGDTLTPKPLDENGRTPDVSGKMLQYQDPTYIISLAQGDYQEVVEGKARALREVALSYSRVASAVDRQDIEALKQELKENVCPKKTTPESDLLKKILLDDYQCKSIDELILTRIKSRKAQAELLPIPFIALPKTERLRFADAKGPMDIFEKFLKLVLDEKDPLPPSVLTHVMHDLTRFYETPAEGFALAVDHPVDGTPLQRVARRFKKDTKTQIGATNALLEGMGGKPLAGTYVPFYESIENKDAQALLASLRKIETDKSALEILSLWHLCHPGESLLTNIVSVSADPVIMASLLEQSLNAGMLDELRVGDNYKKVNSRSSVMDTYIMPHLDKFPVDTARRLIAHSFSTGGLDGYRERLSQAGNNWLEEAVSSNIGDDMKTLWVAALLEPFESDIVKANILAAAAGNASTKKATQLLSNIEENLIGENIRLSDGKILCNLQRVANIWYNSASKTIHYTAQGQGQSNVLLDGVSAEDGEEILSLIRRRGNFLTERGGLFKPENIDTISVKGGKASISWYRVLGSLNTDTTTLAALQKRKDFLHVNDDNGDVSSYNLSSICLLKKQADGTTLMIDKYGAHSVLTGTLTMPADPRFIDIDSTTKFNPENASLMRINAAEGTFEFRIESTDFEKLLDQRTGEFFYTLNVGDTKSLSHLKAQLKKLPDVHTPDNGAFSDLYFNMKALGYLALDKKSSGFYCKRYCPTHKPGFIQVSSEMAESILTGIGKKPGVMMVDDLLVHENSIDDAFYSARKKKLQFVIGHEIQEVPASLTEGQAMLTKLAANKEFYTVSYDGIFPADVIHYDRVTLVKQDTADNNTYAITENSPFPVGLSTQDSEKLFTHAEQQGLKKARHDAKVAPWTPGIGATIKILMPLTVRVAPAIDQTSPQALLAQALGKQTANDNVSKKSLKDAFATVSSLPRAYEQFYYPETKKPSTRSKKTAANKGIPF